MKKTITVLTVLFVFLLISFLTGVAFAIDIPDMNTINEGGPAGTLFLFQKCDDTLKGAANHDSSGCPNIGAGPWPIFPNNDRWGVLDYSLWGKKFEFSFHGRNLLPGKNYTLIYYPDPWPGAKLICLGSGQSNPASQKSKKKGHGGDKAPGNIKIHGEIDIGTSLPASYDANFNPVSPSGAVGAKIWLVLSDDVQCAATSPQTTQMLSWNPTAYLFEYNLIVYENQDNRVDIEED
jgi:hypothetical protein